MILDESKKEARKFYMNINDYHEKSYAILQLITDYFNRTRRTYEKKFLAIRIEDYKVVENNDNLSDEQKERVELWLKSSTKEDLYNSIFKLEFCDKVFLFKFFEFGDGDAILAGYVLNDSVSVRSFLASFNEMKIQEKYQRILSII